MLGTLVAVQTGQSLSTDGVGRDHALDSVGHSQVAVLSHQLAVLDLLQAANVLAVGDVELLLSLLAGQNCLVAVDDNDVIAAIDIGGVVDLLLAAQQNSGLSSDVTQALAGCVEQIPLALDFSGLYESSAHIYFLLISVWYDSGAFGARVSVYNTKKRLSTSFCDFFSGNFYTSQNLLNPLEISRFLKSHFQKVFRPPGGKFVPAALQFCRRVCYTI